jgi:hypothetical protein
MITLKEYFEIVNYRITEGSEYYGYGPGNYSLSYWDGDNDNGVSLNAVFSTQDQTVIMVEVCDYERKRAYRRINPDYQKDHKHDTEAWDDVAWTDLETDEDWVQKAQAIVNYEDYDERVSLPLDLPQDTLMQLFKLAHERDITLNALVEEILWGVIREHRNG